LMNGKIRLSPLLLETQLSCEFQAFGLDD
jgi:hypothetical protein